MGCYNSGPPWCKRSNQFIHKRDKKFQYRYKLAKLYFGFLILIVNSFLFVKWWNCMCLYDFFTYILIYFIDKNIFKSLFNFSLNLLHLSITSIKKKRYHQNYYITHILLLTSVIKFSFFVILKLCNKRIRIQILQKPLCFYFFIYLWSQL